jgi:N,N'-diacetylchitobiose transport system permease protein
VSTVPAPAVPQRGARRARRQRIRRGGWNVVGLAVFAVMAFPVYWMVTTAFKPDTEINGATPTWLPTSPTLDHFRLAIDPDEHPGFWDAVKNSLIIVSGAVVLSVVLAFLAAIALARYRFTGRKLFVVLMIGILMLPAAGLVIPIYVALSRYGLTDQENPLPTGAIAGVVLTFMVFLLPFAVWTLRGFILGVPRELEEAALVDGSSRAGAFFRILLPLVAPGLVATSIFVFITAWNEYIFANVILSSQQNHTLTIWLSYFSGTSRHTDWGALMAASTLTAIPVVIFFLLVQRKIAFGLTAGSVKG